MNKTETIGKVTLNCEYYSGEDLYADGAEDELLEIVKTTQKSEYNKVISSRNRWPILYHLSEIRQNILSWMDFEPDSLVLEIGAGCGAVTGALTPKAKRVDCIDLSKKRSLVNAYRNKDCENLNIYVGNFQDIEPHLNEKYDYITLIGVLEYAALYIDAENPYVEFIKIIKKHLKPGGKVLIAIENQYGLKYFAGCKEDHVGAYNAGIENYRNTIRVRTFSKPMLQKIVSKGGLPVQEMYYPYPDYKFMQSIYSDKYLPKEGQLNCNIRNFDHDRMILMDETQVFNGLIENGMFDLFSNSFFLIASED